MTSADRTGAMGPMRIGTPRRERAVLCLAAQAACLTAILCGCSARDRQLELRGVALGTTYTVKVIVPRQGDTPRGDWRTAVDEALDDVDAKMSTYRDDSEISRFNASTDTTPFQVSEDTVDVLLEARQVWEATGGAFDVTVAPLVNAWGFGPDGTVAALPSDTELAELRQRVGFQYIEIDSAGSTIRKIRPDVSCDLAAIAKGYAVDRVALGVERAGYTRYMVEVGGEVRTHGFNVRGTPWQVAIEKPLTDTRAIEVVVPLASLAMATSGDYRNYYEKDGIRYSHTIDPRTGRPIAHKLASASVIHTECAMADAYATALMVLGPNAGYDLAVGRYLAALFIVREDDGTFAEKQTPAFETLVSAGKGDSH